MIRVKIENTAVDESKAILPVGQIIDWYKDPANSDKFAKNVIDRTLKACGITIDELEDAFSSLDWGAKVNMSRAVRGW